MSEHAGEEKKIMDDLEKVRRAWKLPASMTDKEVLAEVRRQWRLPTPDFTDEFVRDQIRLEFMYGDSFRGWWAGSERGGDHPSG